MKLPFVWIIGWWAVVSVVGMLLALWDKFCARRGRRRVPERRLFTVAGLGAAGMMLVAMLLIRHKTRHWQFMLGLPLMLAAQVALVGFLRYQGILV